VITSGYALPEEPRTDVMSGPCLNSVPFARAADAALAALLNLKALELEETVTRQQRASAV
jgi:hypothetical protein